MNRVLTGYFLGFKFLESIFGFPFSGKVFFWIVQKYPTPLIFVSKYAKSTPWGYFMVVLWPKCSRSHLSRKLCVKFTLSIVILKNRCTLGGNKSMQGSSIGIDSDTIAAIKMVAIIGSSCDCW